MNVPYLVAKYIADPLRMEPVNIGVIGIFDDAVIAKFIGENERSVNIDLRRARGVVRNTAAYKQWIEYWRYLIHSSTASEVVSKIITSSKGNYSVVEGGTLSLPNAVETAEVMDYLFSLLVTEFMPNEDDITLTERCNEIVKEFHLDRNPHFQKNPTVPCNITPDVTEYVQPTFAYINGQQIYFQKVALNPSRPEFTQKDLHNAAWIFEKLRHNNPNSQTKALVQIGEKDDVASFLRVLNTVSSEIIDVENRVQVNQVFSAYAPF